VAVRGCRSSARVYSGCVGCLAASCSLGNRNCYAAQQAAKLVAPVSFPVAEVLQLGVQLGANTMSPRRVTP
jgi:hypothetical protein